VDLQRRLLWRDGTPVLVTAKTFDVLAFLIDRPHRVIAKEEFFEHLWQGTAVLEASLVRQISLLRKALGQRQDSHEYIVTIPGRGYEFVATVERLSDLPDHLEDPELHASHPATALSEAAASTDVPVVPPAGESSSWPSRLALGLTIAVALIAAGVAVVRRDTSDPAPVVRALRQATFEPGSQREPAWSPDGDTIAFTSDATGNGDIWIQAVVDPNPKRLTADEARDSQPSWSPDGRSIVFRSERQGGGIYLVPVVGGDARRIASFGFHPRWSPTGRLIMFSSPSVRTGPREVYVVDAHGGSPRRVAADVIAGFIAGTTAMGWLNSVNVNWHPDGRRVSVWGRLPDGRWQFVTVPESGGPPVVSMMADDIIGRLNRDRLNLGRFTWAPSGRYLYFEGHTENTQNIWRVAVDPETLAWRDGPERLTTGTSADADIAVSADGSRIAFSARAGRTRVWELELDPQTKHPAGFRAALTSGTAGEIDLDASRDGRKLAYRTTRAGRTEVWELDTNSRTERLLVASADWRPTTPRWSLDGRRLAYTRPRPGGQDAVVALLSPEAGHEQFVSLPGGSHLVPSDWSADGTALLGSCRLAPPDPMAVCLLTIESAHEPASVQLLARDATKNLWVPRFSPDQRWVTFVAVDVEGGATSRIYAAPASGGAWTPITDGRSFDDKPRWSPDGRTIYFISSRDGWLNVWGRRFNRVAGRPDGESFQVTSFAGQERILASQMSRLEFGVVGNRLFIPLTDILANIWILDQVDR
jgi:Tol biopolymer transport system component/DNA-binding winged helix-turn-helix (wHTH) protein